MHNEQNEFRIKSSTRTDADANAGLAGQCHAPSHEPRVELVLGQGQSRPVLSVPVLT
jgi:hypothetical protein